jgi:hypothetical protein
MASAICSVQRTLERSMRPLIRFLQAVATENSVRIENTGFRPVREIIIVSTMSHFSSLFLLWSPLHFGPVPLSRLRSWRSAIRSPSCNKARHVKLRVDKIAPAPHPPKTLH